MTISEKIPFPQWATRQRGSVSWSTRLWAHVPTPPTPLLHRTPRQRPRQASSKSTPSLRPQNRQERNNKKISLHRFKPIIFSKMIQNCLNQEDRRFQQTRQGTGSAPRGRSGQAPARRARAAGSLAPLPGPGQEFAGGLGAALVVAGLESVRLVCLVSPRASLGGRPGELPVL